MNSNLIPIEDQNKETKQNNLTPIKEEPKEVYIEPKPGEKNITSLPDWSIEPPVQIKRG